MSSQPDQRLPAGPKPWVKRSSVTLVYIQVLTLCARKTEGGGQWTTAFISREGVCEGWWVSWWQWEGMSQPHSQPLPGQVGPRGQLSGNSIGRPRQPPHFTGSLSHPLHSARVIRICKKESKAENEQYIQLVCFPLNPQTRNKYA